MYRIPVSAVSYINTLPFLYGLRNSPVINRIDLSLDVPSEGAAKLERGEALVALVPTAVLLTLKESKIVSPYCIGCDGPVRSVCLFSDVPLEQVESVFLDPDSRTSNLLLRLLLSEFWKLSPELIMRDRMNPVVQSKNSASLVIGDAALKREALYTYDLGAAWKNYTDLPFVFACWIAISRVPADFLEEFNTALKEGISNPAACIDPLRAGRAELVEYLLHSISYHFDVKKQEALKLFIEKVSSKNFVASEV